MTTMQEIKAAMAKAVNTPHQSTLVVSEWVDDRSEDLDLTLNHTPTNGTYYTYTTAKTNYMRRIFDGDEEKLDNAIDELQLVQDDDFETRYEVVQKIKDILYK
tara:strand:- start:1938 stop:2246 length:309 start_codon:yes stop_codon:yes gene_type:complete